MSSIKGQLIDKDCELIKVSAEKYRMVRNVRGKRHSQVTLFILNPTNVKDVKDLEKAKRLIAELKNPTMKKAEAKKPETKEAEAKEVKKEEQESK